MPPPSLLSSTLSKLPRRLAYAAAVILLALYVFGHRPLFSLGAMLLSAEYILPISFATFLPMFFTRCSERERRIAGWLLLAVASIAGLVMISGYAGDLAPGRLRVIALAVGVVVSASAGGLRLLGWIVPASHSAPPAKPTAAPTLTPGERLILGWGLGMGALSLAVLAVGMAGYARPEMGWALLVIFSFAGAKPLYATSKTVGQSMSETFGDFGWLGWGCLGFCLMNLVLFAPLAFLPPIEYDVLEYHLQLPREYFDAGHIFFAPHNMFAGFPQGMEMLTLLSFMLSGGHASETVAGSTGVWLARLVHQSFYPLLIMSAVLATRRLLDTTRAPAMDAGWLAAALLLACQRSITFSHLLYVELGLGAYTLLALLTIALGWRGVSFMRLAGLAGIFAGLAAGVKYPGLIFVGLPVTLLWLLPVFTAPDESPAESAPRNTQRFRAMILCGGLCWLVVSPWLLKNFMTTGNPFYPLWNQFFSVQDWSAVQETRFQLAHHATDASFADALKNLITSFWRLVIGGTITLFGREVTGTDLGGMGFFFLAGLLTLRGRGARWRLAGLCGWLVVMFGLWFFLTHRIERFFYPGYLLACVLSGCGVGALLAQPSDSATTTEKSAGLPTLLGIVLLLAVVHQGVHIGSIYRQPIPLKKDDPTTLGDIALGRTAPERMLLRYYPPWGLREYLRAIAASEPSEAPPARVLMVGEARPFWLLKQVEYAVVFSPHPLFTILRESASAGEVRARLRARGITHLYINWRELARLHATYHQAYDLTADEQRRLHTLLTQESTRLPLSPARSVADVAASKEGFHPPYARKLLADYAEFFAQPGTWAGQSPHEIYRLR